MSSVLPSNHGASSARAIGGPSRSLTMKPTATATSSARKPSRSWRATLERSPTAFTRGSTSADSTAAPAISAAMKR